MTVLLVAASPLLSLATLLGMRWYEDRMLGDGLSQPYGGVQREADKQAAQLAAPDRAQAA